MSNSDVPVYRLRVRSMFPGLSLIVFSSKDRICATNEDSDIDVVLPRGLYTLRAELDGQFKDKPIRHTGDQTIEPELPPRYTAAPIPGASTAHEYYTEPAWQVSQNPTSPALPWKGEPTSSFMLFIRAPDHFRVDRADQAADLSIRTLDGAELSRFRDDTQRNDEFGYTAFSCQISPGLIILEDTGRRARQVPIRLIQDFQTQVYLMYRGRPLFEDMRIMEAPLEDIRSRAYRDPYNDQDEFEYIRTNEHIDIGLAALQNGVRNIGRGLISKFLNAKFQNPMLGLLGAYLMLLQRHDSSEKSYRENTVRIVLGNLNHLMPGTADILALRLLAAPWLGPPDLCPVNDIPLFRVGTDIILQAAVDNPELIPEGSLLDAVSTRLQGDSVWTSWDPIALPVSPDAAEEVSHDHSHGEMSWVELAIADAIDDAQDELDASQLAQQLGVTNRAVQRAFTQLVERTAEKPDDIMAQGFDLQRMKRGMLNRAEDSLKSSVLEQISGFNKDVPITYQEAYPKIKGVIASVNDTDVPARASDRVEDIVGQWDDPSVRDKVVQQLSREFTVKRDDLLLAQADVETVRDLADVLVKKMFR